MTAVASRVRIQQRGDATVGLREDYMIDERTGLLVKQEKVVATVPVDGGGTATLVGQKTSAVSLQAPPSYSYSRGNYPAIQSRGGPPKSASSSSSPLFWTACSCLVWLAGLAFLIGIPVAKTLQCEPLHNAAITSLVVGGCAFAMGCLCCCCVCSGNNDSKQTHMWCWLFTCVVFLAFTAAVVTNSVFVFTKLQFTLGNGTYIDTGDSDDVITLISCVAPALPFGLAVLSFVLLVLFFLFCCYATALCFSKMDSD